MPSEGKMRFCENDSAIREWQQRVLDEREKSITEGKAVFIDWEAAKDYLLAQGLLDSPPASVSR